MNHSFLRGFSTNSPINYSSYSPYSSPVSSFSVSPVSSFSVSPVSSFSLSPTSYFVVNNSPPKQVRQSVSPPISPVNASSLIQDRNWAISRAELMAKGIDVNIQRFGGFKAQRVEAKTTASAVSSAKAEAKNATGKPQNINKPPTSILKRGPNLTNMGSNDSQPEKQSDSPRLKLNNIEQITQACHGDPQTIISTILNTDRENKELIKFIESFKSYLDNNKIIKVTKELVKEFFGSFEKDKENAEDPKASWVRKGGNNIASR